MKMDKMIDISRVREKFKTFNEVNSLIYCVKKLKVTAVDNQEMTDILNYRNEIAESNKYMKS